MFQVGDRVRFTNSTLHRAMPEYFPPVGTVGEVLMLEGSESLLVQWPMGSTSRDGSWYATPVDLEAAP